MCNPYSLRLVDCKYRECIKEYLHELTSVQTRYQAIEQDHSSVLRLVINMSAASELKAVDKLTITFVVDNCIEWMTKLPPGFIQEVPQHLFHPDVPKDPRTGVPFVDLENYCCGGGKVIGRLLDDPTFEEIEGLGGVVETHAEGHAVAGGAVWVSGEIPRVTHFEGGLPSGVRWVEREGRGEWVKEEDLMDERYAAIDVVGKGLVIFSACSHAGIVNVVKDAVEKFSRPVYMIIGGLHLAGTELVDRIPPTVDYLANQMRPAPTYVLPMHCTGFAAKVALEHALGEGCVPAGVGHKVIVEGTPESERMIHPPTES
ncbi:hypothetical protein FKP32DRAFT_1761112 [Trametes sanguinea]|nr:hypothetical protein FKP32DRAFT_1761112 [Trametes sanguinea]